MNVSFIDFQDSEDESDVYDNSPFEEFTNSNSSINLRVDISVNLDDESDSDESTIDGCSFSSTSPTSRETSISPSSSVDSLPLSSPPPQKTFEPCTSYFSDDESSDSDSEQVQSVLKLKHQEEEKWDQDYFESRSNSGSEGSEVEEEDLDFFFESIEEGEDLLKNFPNPPLRFKLPNRHSPLPLAHLERKPLPFGNLISMRSLPIRDGRKFGPLSTFDPLPSKFPPARKPIRSSTSTCTIQEQGFQTRKALRLEVMLHCDSMNGNGGGSKCLRRLAIHQSIYQRICSKIKRMRDETQTLNLEMNKLFEQGTKAWDQVQSGMKKFEELRIGLEIQVERREQFSECYRGWWRESGRKEEMRRSKKLEEVWSQVQRGE